MTHTAKHTPGPWSLNDKYGIHNTDQVFDTQGDIVADCKWTPKPIDERVANAHLIAAAPAMYEALSMAQATIERLQRHAPGSAQGTLDVIAKALAQAEGSAK